MIRHLIILFIGSLLLISSCGPPEDDFTNINIFLVKHKHNKKQISASIVFINPETGESGSDFLLYDLIDLQINTQWRGLSSSGLHIQHTSIYTPTGSLYRSYDLPFEVDNKGHAIVEDFLAVGGTIISSRGLTGVWRVTVGVDGLSSIETDTFNLIH